ncbi:MAG: FixH family protein [Chloroflexi bacterium]|nr:FixH family protein [Chloroflexota bacterium]
MKTLGTLAAVFLTVLTVLLWPATPSLLAQEHDALEVRQTAGPYAIGVLAERSNLSLGRARFIITVHDRASGEPVPGAEIVIRFKHQADGTEGWASAFGVPKFPGTYNAQTRFVSPGSYLVSIEIQGPLGKGTALLEPLQIPEVRRFTSGSFVFIGLTLVLVGGAAYVWWSASREKKRRESLAKPQDESPGGPEGQSHEAPGTGGQD